MLARTGAGYGIVADADSRGALWDSRTLEDVREVGDGEKGVLVEDVAVKEPLQEVPRHWVRSWSRSCLFWKALVDAGRDGRDGRGGRRETRDARQFIESERARGRSGGDTSRERGLLHIDST